MRVAHVIAGIADAATGPAYSVPRLCDALRAQGDDVHLATLEWGPLREQTPDLNTFSLGLGPRRLGVSPTMQDWLYRQVRADSGALDVVHNHGLWMMPNVYVGRATHGSACPLIVSPRGALSAWALGKSFLRKRLFWHLLQARVLHRAACFHATAQSEADDIRRLGFRQPICVLPNGIDVPRRAARIPQQRRTLLFLGRIHPSKGIDLLLRAWREVMDRHSDWDLRIVGQDNEGHMPALQALAGELGVVRVSFAAALFGTARLCAYRSADLFVLPSLTENFGMTVAEALAAGTPAIVSKGAPWSQLRERGAGWWVDIGAAPLAACLDVALASPPEQIQRMGQAGRAWMSAEFGWQGIAAQMSATYLWLRRGGVAPTCVQLS